MPITHCCVRSRYTVWFVMVLLWWCTGSLLTVQAADKPASSTSSTAISADKPTAPTDKATSSADAATLNPKQHAQSQIENSMANIEIIQQTLESLRGEIENSKEDAIVNRSSMSTIKEGLELIDSKLKEAYTGLDESRNNIAANTTDIEKLRTDLQALGRDVRANATDIHAQKSLIEGNATRLYEILLTIADINKRLEQIVQGNKSQQAEQDQENQKTVVKDMNRLWLLLALVLTLLMPLAYVLPHNKEQYKPLADGIPQHQAILLVCVAVFLGYFAVGFGLMYGRSASGWLGLSNYLLSAEPADATMMPLFPLAEFLLYQSTFVLLAALLVYTALGRQLNTLSHVMLALFVGMLLIPVYGHWVWAGEFIAGNKGWLETAGFVDNAGAIPIHAVASWFALVLVWKLGKTMPRPPNSALAEPDPVYSASAVLLLGLGILGMSTGLLPVSSNKLGSTLLNVVLSASAGSLLAFLQYSFYHTDKGRMVRGLGGFASGLVAAAATAQLLTPLEAIALGAIAGILHNLLFNTLIRYVLPHSWQMRTAALVAIHGGGGIWGSLSVSLLGAEGLFSMPDITQLVIQLQGIAVSLVYGVVLAHIAWLLFNLRRQPAVIASPSV